MVEKGKSPQMTGLLLTDAADPKERKSIGKVALWENTNLANLNAPVLRGVIQTEKGKYRIALWWVKEKEGDNPLLLIIILKSSVIFSENLVYNFCQIIHFKTDYFYSLNLTSFDESLVLCYDHAICVLFSMTYYFII